MFYLATTVQIEDKKQRLPHEIVAALGLPASIENFFDYRELFPGIYNRLFQFCIISLCCDAERFFRDLFEDRSFTPGNGSGFYQRFTEVMTNLEKVGFDFGTIEHQRECLVEAFQIRHICVHNLGIVDQRFIDTTGYSGNVGDTFTVTDATYKDAYDAYCELLRSIDSQLNSLKCMTVT